MTVKQINPKGGMPQRGLFGGEWPPKPCEAFFTPPRHRLAGFWGGGLVAVGRPFFFFFGGGGL